MTIQRNRLQKTSSTLMKIFYSLRENVYIQRALVLIILKNDQKQFNMQSNSAGHIYPTPTYGGLQVPEKLSLWIIKAWYSRAEQKSIFLKQGDDILIYAIKIPEHDAIVHDIIHAYTLHNHYTLRSYHLKALILLLFYGLIEREAVYVVSCNNADEEQLV